MPIQAYSFLDVAVSIDGPGGNFQLGSGAAPDKEGITIEFADDKNKQDIAADGTPLNSLRAAKNGKITVRLQKNSPANANLSSMYNTQIQSSANWGQNVITVTNLQTGDDYTCQAVAFKKFPSNSYQEEATRLEWEFDAGIIDPLLGQGMPSIN